MSYYLKPPNVDPKFLGRIEGERNWILNRIESLRSSKLPRKPRAHREIRDLEYQLRHRELELAFCGPEWSKYEKYGLWDILKQ